LAWQVKISDTARRQLKKLERQVQRKILDYLKKRIETNEDPQRFGKPLRGSLTGLWKYRIGDYRIICEIRKNEVVVLVLRVGHRRKVYGGH
jgi:mRNA interferase RelE/StbE